MRLKSIRNIFILLFVASFFFFPRLQTIFISIAFLLTFFTGEFSHFKQRVLKNPLAGSFLALFFLGLISLLWTENMDAGLKAIEIKFSFLAFSIFLPLIFFKNNKFNQVLNILTVSSVVYIFLSFARAVYFYYQTNDLSVFYGSALGFRVSQEGPFVHPTYVSFYFLTLTLIWGKNLIDGSKEISISSSIGKIGLLFCFIVFLFFCSSKAGLLGLGIVVLLLLVFFAKKEKKILQSVGVLLLFVLITCIGVYNTNLKTKLEQAYIEFTNPDLKPDANLKSTGARIWIWKASKELIKQNTLLGVGIGDTKDELSKMYKTMGIKTLEKSNLDSHQQFLQTFLTLGVLGISLLLLIFVILFYLSYKQKNFILFGFTLLYFVFGFTESMLETQAGILFFVFFTFLLYYYKSSETEFSN